MSILETICEERREAVARARRERPASSLERGTRPVRPSFAPRRPEGGRPRGRPFLIAECKRASPSRGLLVPDYDPAALAQAYEEGGAALVSVLTEPRHFLGAETHLSAVRAAVELPLLRKDFIVDPWQLRETWALGADALLLIAACLEPSLLAELAAGARELGLSTLVELREAEELDAALRARPSALGVNARDLRDFSLSPGRSLELLREIEAQAPPELPRVAESGLRRGSEARPLLEAGYDGFLVGEAFATAAEPAAAVAAFLAELGAGGTAR